MSEPEKFDAAFPGARLYGKEEMDALRRIVDTRTTYRFYGIELPTQVDELERQFERSAGRQHALAVSSGTAALHCAFHALGVEPGDEIIIPGFAWVANLMAVLAVDAVPVIAAVDESLGLDPDRLDGVITDKTKGIVAVHMRGYPCRIGKLQEVAKSHDLFLVEDACQALGAKIGDRPAGSFGDASVFSFQYHKLLTAGEGGMLLVDQEQLYAKAARFHDNGLMRRAGDPDPSGIDCIGAFGMNYRMNEVQAALLLAQLEKLPALLARLADHANSCPDRNGDIIEKYRLEPRPRSADARPNHAFICYRAPDAETAEAARQALRSRSSYVEVCSDLNAHHYKTWAHFMSESGYEFRLHDAEISDGHLSRSLAFT